MVERETLSYTGWRGNVGLENGPSPRPEPGVRQAWSWLQELHYEGLAKKW